MAANIVLLLGCHELKLRSYSLSLPCKVGLLWQLAPPNVLKSGPTVKGPVEKDKDIEGIQ
ncbi:hypothetical protein OUZ56_021441 [Daphnia magna]|uniref:Uncharacterized protein n=1 Tax=Daphnia magna TaxID=35525 RepID=A0ABQ9ZHF0_9CRUS|nr:hypothetical protein OUZ56_021441 [Daphnia magna]